MLSGFYKALVYSPVTSSATLSVFAFKGKVHPKIKKTHFFVLSSALFIHQDFFGMSCRVLEMSAVEMSAFSQI